MRPPGLRRAPADAAGRLAFARVGLAVVVSAASFLLDSTTGGGTVTVPAGNEWQLLMAFALLAAGSLCLMRGMRLRDGDARRPPAILLAPPWNAGERLLLLLLLLHCPFLEAW